MFLEETFHHACERGDIEEVTWCLEDPDLDINCTTDPSRCTVLHSLCWNSHSRYGENSYEEILKLLVVRPELDVNARSLCDKTALINACHMGYPERVRILLQRPELDVSTPDLFGCTPFWWTCYSGDLTILKLLIASGKDLVPEQGGMYNYEYYSPTAIASLLGNSKLFPFLALLESYLKEPIKTTMKIQRELGMLDKMVANTFAQVVFVADDLLRVRGKSPTSSFFNITSRLPLELQMLTCRRVYDDPREIILCRDSEPAFRDLAKK